jgi:glycosyltransferase involved in cell wall biosynthesis
MTKIALVITKSEFGGAQEYLRILMFSMKRYEIVLITGDVGFLTEVANKLGCSFRVCRGLIHPIQPLQDLRAIFNMYRLLREEKPALIHANSSKAGIIARISALIAGIPVVFTAHGWAFTEGVSSRRSWFYKCVEKSVAPLAQKIICVSGYDRKLALDYGVGDGSRLLTVHNGIPDVAGCVATHSNAIPRVVMVARFAAPKDYGTLLCAVSLLKDCSFRVQCVGDGPLLHQSRQLSERLGVQEAVEFLGERNDVVNILRNADIFVLVSNWEGFPISVLEGMRAGLPVVATRVGGMPESVSDQHTGLLVEPGDSVGLANALRTLITQPCLRTRMGSAGRERYLSAFTSERMIAKTTEVYDSILVGGQRREGLQRSSWSGR